MKFPGWIKFVLLYVILVFGGLWHLLQFFQPLMQAMAAPLIIALGIWLFYENWRFNASGKQDHQSGSSSALRLAGWSAMVVVLSITIEGIGVKTGVIFGSYQYGTSLPPYIAGVPLSIGFAWLGMLFSSAAMAYKIFPGLSGGKDWQRAVMVAVFMTIFDAFMEPAAMKLNYWSWQQNSVPAQNYLAWFSISFFLFYIGKKYFHILNLIAPIGYHAYMAQLIYFILVNFS